MEGDLTFLVQLESTLQLHDDSREGPEWVCTNCVDSLVGWRPHLCPCEMWLHEELELAGVTQD